MLLVSFSQTHGKGCREKLLPFTEHVRLLGFCFFSMVFISCTGSGQRIDGSSQGAYQRSLAQMLENTSEHERALILEALEFRFANFKSHYPALAIPKTQEQRLRPPEFLALLHGVSREELIQQAEVLERARTEAAKEAKQRLQETQKLKEELRAGREEQRLVWSECVDLVDTYLMLAKGFVTVTIESVDWKAEYLKLSLRFTNEGPFPVSTVRTKLSVVEQGRSLPWVQREETFHFRSGLASGEQRDRRSVQLGMELNANDIDHRDSIKCIVEVSRVQPTKGHIKLIDKYAYQHYTTDSNRPPIEVMRQDYEALFQLIARTKDQVNARDPAGSRAEISLQEIVRMQKEEEQRREQELQRYLDGLQEKREEESARHRRAVESLEEAIEDLGRPKADSAHP